MKHIRTATIVLFVAASLGLLGCGGGGGGAAGGGQIPPPIGEALAQQIIENCGNEALLDFLDFLSRLQPLFDGQGQAPAIQITGFQGLPPTGFDWTLDLDGDFVPDLFGGFEFTDDMGNPTTPFDLTQLSGGFDNFAQLLASIPDGTQLLINYVSTDPMDLSGAMLITFTGGTVSDMAAEGTSATVDCNAVFGFTGLDATSFSGAFPVAVFTALLQATEGIVEGSATFDGTETALFEVNLDGETEVFRFLVNLTDGSVAPAP